MNNFNKILNELSYRVSSGIPDLTNEQHLIKLWDILKEHNWSVDARVELLKNLQEIEFKDKAAFAKYKAKHKMRPTTKITIGDKETTVGDETGEKDETPKAEEFFKDIKKVDTLNSEEYKKPLETTDKEFDGSNKENATPVKFELSEDSRNALTKVAPKYVELLERVLNTGALKKNEDGKYVSYGNNSSKLGYFGVGGQGAGTTKSAMGELMTQTFSTLRSNDLFGKKDENGMYGGGLYRDILNHIDKLEEQGVKTHLDKSWVKAAMENRSAIMAHFREKFGTGYEIVATSWDVPEEVEALGLPYDKKQSTTDTFFKVKDKDGNERILECSLKKSFQANLFNGTLKQVAEGAETEIDVAKFASDQTKNLDNVFGKKQDTINSVLNNLDITDSETKDLIFKVGEKIGGVRPDNQKLVRDQLNHSLKQIQEDLLSNPNLKIDRDYIGNVTQAGAKKGKFTKALKDNNKVMLSLLEVVGGVNNEIKTDVEKHRNLTSDFETKAIKELGTNESFKESALSSCRENLPLKDILEGKEFMAAGQTPVTKKTLEAMFGTTDWSKVKENLQVDLEPKPQLVYRGEVEGSKREIKFANIGIREDGKGYSGGRMKFELSFNNNFRDFANGESSDIYDQHRPEGGQIPIKFKKKKK